MRSPQIWGGGYSHWGSRVVLTFPLEWPGPSPFGGLQGSSEQEPHLDKVPGGLICGPTCLGPPAVPRLERCWVTAPHVLPGLPALNRGAGVC